MRVILKQKKIFYIILLIAILICIYFTLFYINSKVIFKLEKDNLVNDFSITKNSKTYTGNLYEQDILYTGKITNNKIEEYIENIKIPKKNVIAVKYKFYNSINDNDEIKPYNIDYEVYKILIE